jgi:hypothetical protein
MLQRSKDKIVLLLMLAILSTALVGVDREFFKRNSSFSVRFLYSCLPNKAEWDLPKPSSEQEALLDKILAQKFHYLAKGAHCYAFVSEDQNYVVKFHRYPSHMRIFPWLTHPFSYQFNERRKKIKEHNFQKLATNLTSYKDSYLDLQEETGVILVHINRTENLRKKITLVDKTQAEYRISLDDVTFILQYKADLIYPTLDRLIRERKLQEAKQVVSNIIRLITSCCQKGYVDEDPVLRKNYGLLADRAIHIDVGDLVKNEKIVLKENYIPHVKEMTESLRKRLENNYPELLSHYQQEMGN